MITKKELTAVERFLNGEDGLAVMPGTKLLEASARNNAEIAIQFIEAGNRMAAREHLKRAIEQLNVAELE